MNRGTIIEASTRFMVEDCSKCGMLFAMPVDFKNRRVSDKKTFYCPSGHPMTYTGKTEEANLREQLQREKCVRKWAEERAERAERASAKAMAAIRQKRAYKGHLTRTKNRISKGVCPCCNKHFEKLQRHMATKHPEYAREEK